MIDILYIKGVESPSKDEELRFSLRSLKCVKDVGRVFITGKCPSFVKNVIFTPCDDIGCKTINHWWKVTQTILQTDISDDFVLMYDDIFFTNDVNLSDYPFYNRGRIEDHKTGTAAYRENLKEAQRVLEKMKMPTLDYTLHIPCIYNRDRFLEMKPLYMKYIHSPVAPSVRCMYGNLFDVKTEFREDIKIRTSKDSTGDNECFSTADDTFKCVLPLLKEKFPEECKYENSILFR